MKKTIRRMTLAALLLAAAPAVAAEQKGEAENGVGGVRQVAYVGDVPTADESAYFGHKAAAPAPKHSKVQVAQHNVPAQMSMPVINAAPARSYAPVQAGQLQPIGSQIQQVGACAGGGCADPTCAAPTCAAPPMSSCDTGGCASIGCDSGGCDSVGSACDAMGGSCGSGGMAGALGLCGKSGWMRHEALLWFVQDRDAPALVATTPSNQVIPFANLFATPPTTTNFGEALNGDISLGYRLDAGLFLSDNMGVGGRFWWLSENEDSISLSGDGSNQFIGRPFFDINSGVEAHLIVALQGAFIGNVEATSKLDMMAAEAYTRTNLSCTKTCQLDFIGGFSYFDVDDRLSITSSTIDVNTGRNRTFNDLFDAENEFIGGNLGFEAIVTSGRWFARSLTKVHLGNMDSTINISGTASDQTPPLGATITDGGFLALGNQGTYSQEEFSFIPEMNFKLGYRFREHVEMTVGYTFLMFDNLALAGDQVDRSIDPTTLNTSGPHGTRPAFDFQDSSLWVQGLDLGLAITF